MPLLPSALPPKGEARRYVANDFLNLIALPMRGEGLGGATLPEGKGLLCDDPKSTMIDLASFGQNGYNKTI